MGEINHHVEQDAKTSLLIDIIGVLASRMPGDDAIRLTTADRVALRGVHVVLTPDVATGDLLIQLVRPVLVEEGAAQ